MSAYYNENDPFVAAWLRELIKADLIAPGDVDERSITEVTARDVAGYVQCHFFAGIGGWSYAIRLAGWPDSRPVWTGSCPCQGYSAAGKQKGAADARNLWPVWFRLIRERKPVPIFGEQVANAAGHGWLDAVSTDLEAEGYAFGAAVLGAHSLGAPHVRQRLWFVAHAHGGRFEQCYKGERAISEFDTDGPASVMANTWLPSTTRQREHSGTAAGTGPGRLSGRREDLSSGVGLAIIDGHEGRPIEALQRTRRRSEGSTVGFASGSPWASADWLPCRDSRARPVESGTFPLAHGVSARVGRLRGYGNAIVPQVAAEVIRAYMDITQEAVA